MRSSTFRSSFAACASSTGCAWVKVTNRSPAAPLKLALISRISLRRALRSLSRSISSLLSARFSPRAILRPSRVAKYLSTSSSRPERVIFSKYGIFDSPFAVRMPAFGVHAVQAAGSVAARFRKGPFPSRSLCLRLRHPRSVCIFMQVCEKLIAVTRGKSGPCPHPGCRGGAPFF